MRWNNAVTWASSAATAEVRRRNLRFLAYNPRYPILPWVRVSHLASHILGQMARRIAGD